MTKLTTPQPNSFAVVPFGLTKLGLDLEQLQMVLLLLNYCGPSQGKLTCWPSLQTISAKSGFMASVNHKKADRILSELVPFGLRIVNGRFAGKNRRTYDLTDLWAKAVAATPDFQTSKEAQADEEATPTIVAGPVAQNLVEPEPPPAVCEAPTPPPTRKRLAEMSWPLSMDDFLSLDGDDLREAVARQKLDEEADRVARAEKQKAEDAATRAKVLAGLDPATIARVLGPKATPPKPEPLKLVAPVPLGQASLSDVEIANAEEDELPNEEDLSPESFGVDEPAEEVTRERDDFEVIAA